MESQLLDRRPASPMLAITGRETGLKCPLCGKNVERAMSFSGFVCLNRGRVFLGEIGK